TEKGENTHDFTVGVRANNLAAGDYENELIFTAVANPEPQKTYLSMQDVADWKDTLEEEQQVQVKDARDGKIYWVAKLKDGNIWMTQNLDYDLSVAANQTLTPETSNVTENRTVTPVAWGTDNNSVYYMDGGDNYFANGTTKTAGLASLPENSIDRHYAQGDYYSWKAATAGQGTTDIVDADVNESICPSGWRLPTSNSDSANYSFGNLVKQYGYTGENQDNISDATLLASPLFFVRGGYVYSGSLYYQGSDGLYWSSGAFSNSDGAYHLGFISSYVGPSDDDYRNLGLSVRCVAL
ncbi:MAG: fibrobacter succinogenes major paralogous domain-containing protein, partial [Candidatus Saccharibacteria bacterium]|nr:fibrobacter succinogenes major paralogous domain-containing protein [Candidatus Saccharibacteria bacterium]